jgi:hypothetical protein
MYHSFLKKSKHTIRGLASATRDVDREEGHKN